MLSIPWDALSPLYKTLVGLSMGLSAIGIVLAIIGASTETLPLLYSAVGVIIIGVLLHVGGLVVRGRDARAYRLQQEHSPRR
ncbi:hypothetical protein [Zhihengliuella salsuginis]|uniref:DUF3188 domain-containing protein n=1 Tax=Zhihengliuella salsuginis TaxID=578222 RepID=A0ABQ3GJ38_9MICC|nr:hypothetical protein [Zhihengliuella salsuginis]GHD10059.1 hypothetical protein GCM10008096_23190 [Zhihengliuella salsuginis]